MVGFFVFPVLHGKEGNLGEKRVVQGVIGGLFFSFSVCSTALSGPLFSGFPAGRGRFFVLPAVKVPCGAGRLPSLSDQIRQNAVAPLAGGVQQPWLVPALGELGPPTWQLLTAGSWWKGPRLGKRRQQRMGVPGRGLAVRPFSFVFFG